MKKFNYHIILLILVTCFSCSEKTTKTEAPPNVIIIFTDDQGYGDLSSFGHPSIITPHLDQMAHEGQKWTQFYAAAPVCTPSRAGLLTGRYPIRNGMTSSKSVVLFPNSAGGLPQSEITIAEVLKQRNYATGMIGKWHLGHLPQFLPQSQGFDYYYGIPYSNDMDAVNIKWSEYKKNLTNPNLQSDFKRFNVPLMENSKIIERPADQNTITKRYTEKAVEYIKSNKDKPFFLYLAHSLPHIPLFANKDFIGSSNSGLYGDVIQEIDWSVGRVIQTLKDLNLDDNTIVVFSSDNGPWLSYKTHGGSAGPLREGKGTTFEGGQRVPTIFWGPSIVKPKVVNQMGSTLDIIHTVASITNTTIPSDRKMDSYDLSPVLKGESETSNRNEFFYWSRAKPYAVRSNNWKLHIRQKNHPSNKGKNTDVLEFPELYNLEADISEKYDLSNEKTEIVEQLKSIFESHKADTEDSLSDNLALKIEE